MVIVVFRSRLRPEHVDEFERDAAEMLGLAQSMPGFISYKRYLSEDGERISLHEWQTAEHLRASSWAKNWVLPSVPRPRAQVAGICGRAPPAWQAEHLGKGPFE